jgi:hypothetical protein
MDFGLVGGAFLVRSAWNTFCPGLLLALKRASCAYLLLLGRGLAAVAKGRLVSCEPKSSVS